MADQMKPTPRSFISGLFSDVLGGTLNMPSMPRTGIPSIDLLYANRNSLFNMMGVGDVQKTAERISYGEPLTTGQGMTMRPREETIGAALTVAPFAPAAGRVVGRAIRATEGMPVGMSIKDVSYRGSHRAPNAKTYGATLDDLTKILPEDVYSQQGKQLYGIGDRMIDSEWRVAALKARGKPNAEVEIFRAVPKGVKDINNGDWVSTSKAYAKQHGESTLGGDYEIISKKVPAKTLSTEGYPYEYGYNTNFEYPQQAALDLAQQRAALPVSEGGLGLPANNTPMDRAKAMGFDVNALHGSPNPNIQQFDPTMAGLNTGNAFDNNIFATTSPESATGYALNWEHYRNQVKTSPEYKAISRQENDLLKDLLKYKEKNDTKGIADVESKIDSLAQQRKRIYSDFLAGKIGSQGSTIYPLMVRSQDFLPYEASGAGWMRANRPAIDAAESAGYSGALIKNVKDNAGANLGTIADVYATPDATRFRSRFAAFDPFRKDVATATAMGVALPDLLAQPVNQYQQTYETTPMYTDPFGNTIGSSIR